MIALCQAGSSWIIQACLVMLVLLAVTMEMRRDCGCTVCGTLVQIGATNALILTGRIWAACQQRK
jgi:hypothetical protein